MEGSAATIKVTRSGSSVGAVTVNYATSDGTAQAGADYSATSGTLTFGAGVTSLQIKVPTIGNTVVNPSRTVNLTLSNPTGGAVLVGSSTAVLTIVNDDKAGKVQFGTSSFTVNESSGTVTIKVNRSRGNGSEVTVNYATSDGTAQADTDYTATSGTLTFGAGVTSRRFSIPILKNTLGGAARTVILTLSNPGGGATLGSPSTAALMIRPQ
jgi:hypothetical protein